MYIKPTLMCAVYPQDIYLRYGVFKLSFGSR